MINYVNINAFSSSMRQIEGSVEHKHSTATQVFYDNLQNIKIERLGEDNKFFGFGVCQKMTIQLRDKDKQVSVAVGDELIPTLSIEEGINVKPAPTFYVDSVERNDTTNQLTIISYDKLYSLQNKKYSDIVINTPYTVISLVNAIAKEMGISATVDNPEKLFDLSYPKGANLNGDENLRTVLDQIAQATGTVYYINYKNVLIFKRLGLDKAEYTIDRKAYFNCSNKGLRQLTGIASITELGDNILAGDETGDVCYIRDNAFIELREDIPTILNSLLIGVSPISITEYEIKWRGAFITEIGDKVRIQTKDDTYFTTYLLNDTMEYRGGYNQVSSWQYDNEAGEQSNSSTIGEAIKNTTAKVDKVKQTIELTVKQVDENSSAITALNLHKDKINASVETIIKNTEQTNQDNSKRFDELQKQVDLAMDADSVNIAINKALQNGVDKVETSTGFRFDENGLNVSKSTSEMETLITENGMIVSKSGQTMLTANADGVDAKNLHATTYLIVGNNSRFEDYEYSRTGCFWINDETYSVNEVNEV